MVPPISQRMWISFWFWFIQSEGANTNNIFYLVCGHFTALLTQTRSRWLYKLTLKTTNYESEPNRNETQKWIFVIGVRSVIIRWFFGTCHSKLPKEGSCSSFLLQSDFLVPCFLLSHESQGWRSDEDHVSGEAVKRDANPAEPDRLASGFWGEQHLLTDKGWVFTEAIVGVGHTEAGKTQTWPLKHVARAVCQSLPHYILWSLVD